jgi:hypothetical protein
MMMNKVELFKFLDYLEGGGYETDDIRDYVQKLINKSKVKEIKEKKDIPTVIEYQGRRYILDAVKNRQR